MSPKETGHRYISLADHAMDLQTAATRIYELLTHYTIPCDKDKFMANIGNVTSSGAAVFAVTDRQGKSVTLDLFDMLCTAQKTGEVPELDRLRWRDADEFGSIVAATTMEVPLTVQTGPRKSPALLGPGFLTNNLVSELLDDVVCFRQQTTENSVFVDSFRPCFHAYRAYLTACVTAIDSWLNREAYFVLRRSNSDISAANRKKLEKVRQPLNNKLRQWMPIVGKCALDETSAAWSHFQEIKDERNGLIHQNEPDYVFQLESATKTLNKCQLGVGQLLLDLYASVERAPLAATYRVRYAPTASYGRGTA